MGYSPWGRKELDTTERLHFTKGKVVFLLLLSFFFFFFPLLPHFCQVWGRIQVPLLVSVYTLRGMIPHHFSPSCLLWQGRVGVVLATVR